MKISCSFIVLLVLSSSECLIFPLYISTKDGNCGKQSEFKSIGCNYNGVGLYTTVTLVAPNFRNLVRLVVDTGSSETWLTTSATRLLNLNGTQRRWADIAATYAINYAPHDIDNLNIKENLTYMDGASILVNAYRNHQLEFIDSSGRIKVPMDLYFAEQFIIPDSSIPLRDHGMLALRLRREPKDLNNLFLHQFLKAYPHLDPMMSFNINWDQGNEQPSCFALGESLPIKNTSVRSITLESDSDDWTAEFILYMQLEFSDGKSITIAYDTKEQTIGKRTYLNATGIEFFYAHLDSGYSNIGLSDYFVEQMNAEEKELFKRNFTFHCSQYKQVLPTIRIGFFNADSEMISVTVPARKLYRRNRNDPDRCHSLLELFPYDDANMDKLLHLGLPFFASVYLEMHWKDTTKIENWNQTNFSSEVIIAPK